MNKSKWPKLKGFDAWNKELAKLLAEATKAAQEDSFSVRLKVSQDLSEFIDYSRPSSEEVDALDEIAANASIGLMNMQIDERLAQMQGRTAEYKQLTKAVANFAKDNKKQASAIRLENIESILLSTSKTILAVNQLKETLDTESETEQQLAKAMEKAVKTLFKLKSDVAGLLQEK